MVKVKRQMPPVKKAPGRKGTTFSSQGISSRIQALDFDTGLSMCLYGRSGTGKTTFAGSFPGKLLWVICSSGKNPGELRSLNTPENRKRIDRIVIEKVSDITEVTNYLENNDKYQTVVVDHVTSFADKVLAEILGIEKTPEQKFWGMATQQQYGQCTLQCKELLRPILDLPHNRIFIGQERVFGGDEENQLITPRIGPAVSPALAGWLEHSCDYLLGTYLRPQVTSKKITQGGKQKIITKETGKVEYCLRIYPHPTYASKVRIPKEFTDSLPECIVDPDYDKFMEVIQQAQE